MFSIFSQLARKPMNGLLKRTGQSHYQVPSRTRSRLRLCRQTVSSRSFRTGFLYRPSFYHTRLHCYIVVELKVGDFKPEYAGQINFYLSALDDLVKTAEDNSSIGLVLCATRDKILAEYALRDIKKPIGIAEWKTKLTRSLPAKLSTASQRSKRSKRSWHCRRPRNGK